MAYGKKIGVFQGPFPSSYEISRKEATLTVIYDFNANKIQQRSSGGFEVCVAFLSVLILKLSVQNLQKPTRLRTVLVILKFHNNEIKKLHISRPADGQSSSFNSRSHARIKEEGWR